MTVIIKDHNGPISLSHIEKLEASFSIQLPEKYRSFLHQYNGGVPDPDAFNFIASEDGSCVDRFLGINVGKHSNLENYLKTYINRIPKGFFPIAHDPGGNLILLGLDGNDREKVYFWDHELEADGYMPNKSNMTLIADDFDSFLGCLYEIEE